MSSMSSLSPNPTRNPSWKRRPQRRSPSPCPGKTRGATCPLGSAPAEDSRRHPWCRNRRWVELVPHRIAFPSPPSLECCPFVPVSVVTIGDRLRQDVPPPHPCPTADCCFYPSLSPSSSLDPPPSSSRRVLHLNLCCRHGGLILPLPGRHLRYDDCYVPLVQAHDDVNLLQPSSTSKPPLFLPLFLWIGCAFLAAVAAAAVAQSSSSCLFCKPPPAARLQRTRRWLVVVCPHRCPPPPPPLPLSDATPLLLSSRPSLSSPDNDADPPPEVGDDRPLDVPEVNERSPIRPPRINCRHHRRRRMPPLPRVTSLAEGEDKGHDPSPSISS